MILRACASSCLRLHQAGHPGTKARLQMELYFHVQSVWAVMSLGCQSAVVARCQGAAETLQYDAIVVAVGNYAQPNLPSSVAGMRTFPGLQMHCHNFRSPRQFAGQTVLVVGASFSGECLSTAAHSKQEGHSRQIRTLSGCGPQTHCAGMHNSAAS